MKIISWNVNGIRAISNKGFLDYLKAEDPDILCLQETKAEESDLPEHILAPSGYHGIWFSAEKKGYSGTAILTKSKPISVSKGYGSPKFDSEGRVVMAEYNAFTLFSVYFPNGQRDDERLAYKLDFYDDFFRHCNALVKAGKNIIICGDYNTAHHPIDLARPKENETTSGFMPIEREWLDKIVKDGWVDTFRHHNPDPDHYTWWSYRTRARDRNIGWRIDYCFANEAFMPKIDSAFIQQDVLGSDHCPVGIILKK